MYKLYTSYQKRVRYFPKYYRFTLGARIDDSLLEMLEHLILAQKKTKKSKVLLLEKADVKLQVLKLLIRASHELEALPHGGYISLQKQVIEIGKMLGGWIKYTKEHG